MLYQGHAVKVCEVESGVLELNFDLQGESVNKFNAATFDDLRKALAVIQAAPGVKGLLVSSGKGVFIVGADITEFTAMFRQSAAEIAGWGLKANEVFAAIEDLPFPSVVAINGYALGGGMEMCLSVDYRVMSSAARVGLPEVKLGIFPAFGGTVRLSRLVGAAKAIEWIASGIERKADQALKDGAVDVVAGPEELRETALAVLREAISGQRDWQAQRRRKVAPVADAEKLAPLFDAAEEQTARQYGPNYPAAVAAIRVIRQHVGLDRLQAITVEVNGFGELAKTSQAGALVGNFLNDQSLKKSVKKHLAGARSISRGAVIGAGIMGGGIAYQSALRGVPVLMKDIRQEALALGMSEAEKLLGKVVEKGRMSPEQKDAVMGSIKPQLDYAGLAEVDVVVEAVVENVGIKKSVLAEVEGQMRADAVLASNTSTILITELAKALQRPENFVGMHFFNPVHMMPLVEVIRGEKSSPEAVATTVAYAQKMGKVPVVVNDCPGFLVNRILFPYVAGFGLLVRDGVDFRRIDRVMEAFGWPMGPAYLLDVVGIDTGVHAANVIADGFPDRLKFDFPTPAELMFAAKRLGQKNGLGFYRYEADAKGKPRRADDDAAYAVLQEIAAGKVELSDEDIVDRMMIPMCLEAVRCLEDGIVGTSAELDMSLLLGIGFPAFRGGALRHIEQTGLAAFVERCDRYAHLGGLYKATERLRQMAASGASFFD